MKKNISTKDVILELKPNFMTSKIKSFSSNLLINTTSKISSGVLILLGFLILKNIKTQNLSTKVGVCGKLW